MNPTTPTPRPAHAFTGSARANRAKLVSQFQSDLRSAYVDSSTIRLYDKVSVVAFHWENDNLNVVPLETELLEVFRDQYRFDTSSYTIPIGPNVNSNTQLIRHLLDHADQSSGENTLRIYVYSGHSYDPGMISQVWNLAGDLSPNAPTVNWWAIRGNLETYAGSVCYIFDTCAAVSAVFESNHGVEFMGATGWNTAAPSAANASFTRALIDTLSQMSGQNSTLATVYSTLLREARSSQIGVSPIYISKPNTQSVTIGNTDRYKNRRSQVVARNHMRVLLGVNINDINDPRALDINFWRQWAPHAVHGMEPGSIRVEAVYIGSLLVLFSIPVEMWVMLPDDPAYTYVSHISSTNLLAIPPPIDLPFRPPRDTKENRSPSRSRSPPKPLR